MLWLLRLLRLHAAIMLLYTSMRNKHSQPRALPEVQLPWLIHTLAVMLCCASLYSSPHATTKQQHLRPYPLSGYSLTTL